MADSSFPTAKSARVAAGTVVVEAKSDQLASSSKANVEAATPGAPSGTAEVTITGTAEQAEAVALTKLSGLEVGPLVIEGLRSSAKVVRSGSGLKRESSLSAVGVSVAGTPLTIDDRGINVAGTTLPYQDSSALVGVLAQAGITLAYQAGFETKYGVVSPNLTISVRQPVPDNPVASVPSVTYTFILGEASASVGGQAFTDADPVVTPEQPTSEPAPVLDPEAPVVPSLDSGSAPLDPGTAVSPPVVDPPAAQPQAPAPVTTPQFATRASVEAVAWSTSFYLALAGAALLVVLVLTLVRYLGVRYP